MKLETDGQRAKIEISDELDAAGMEQLIVKLAMIRSQMQPEVTHRAPGGQPEPAERTVLQCDDSGLVVAQLRDGRYRFWLRNTGIGWCAYTVPAATAHGISRYIASRLPDGVGPADLFSDEGGQKH